MFDKLVLWHPLLVAVIIVIMPFQKYAGLISPAQAFLPLIVICAFILISYLIIKRIVKKRDVAVSVTTPLLIIFFNFGIFYEYTSSLTDDRIKFKGPVLILATLFIFIILVVYIIKVLRTHEGTLRHVNKFFFIIALAIIFSNASSIAMRSCATDKAIKAIGSHGLPLQKQIGPFPDIYFVILDEYAALSQMKSYFNYDLSPFVEYLKQKEFMVTEMNTGSTSTSIIIEERLNMENTNRLDGAVPSISLSERFFESTNIRNSPEIEKMIHLRNSKVILYLIGLGYQFVNIGSWFAQTRYNRLADQNINCYGFQFKDELSAMIAGNSVLRLFWINRYFHRTAVLDAFDALKNMPIIPGKPKFVFAHIICPHVPYIFRANGEHLDLNQGKNIEEKQCYIDQHIFITKKIKEFIDFKLSTSHPLPVIVIQADHGARMDKSHAHQVFNAVYIQNYKGNNWLDSTPSVNTFRLLFNALFGFNFNILP